MWSGIMLDSVNKKKVGPIIVRMIGAFNVSVDTTIESNFLRILKTLKKKKTKNIGR